MVYLFTNITDSSPDPKIIYIGDIPGRVTVNVNPGQTVDLELLSTRNQICESLHIRSHVLEGRATADTLGTEPEDDCRIWVTGIDLGDIMIGEIKIEEPIQISVDVNGTETPVTGTQCDSKTGADVNVLYPNTPRIDDVPIASVGTEVPLTLPVNTKKYLILGLEEDFDTEVGFVSGGNTIPIPCGTNYSEEGVQAGSVILYFKANKAPRTVKVLSWSCV